ncbi:hypothetical protein SNEBB_003341 [Seison nebaliae]|nr:hypothetical protein SNEBB_003341 [Seison nebaliae]
METENDDTNVEDIDDQLNVESEEVVEQEVEETTELITDTMSEETVKYVEPERICLFNIHTDLMNKVTNELTVPDYAIKRREERRTYFQSQLKVERILDEILYNYPSKQDERIIRKDYLKHAGKVTIIGGDDLAASILFSILNKQNSQPIFNINQIVLYSSDHEKTKLIVDDLKMFSSQIKLLSATHLTETRNSFMYIIAINFDLPKLVFHEGTNSSDAINDSCLLEHYKIVKKEFEELIPILIRMSPNAYFMIASDPVEFCTFAAHKIANLQPTEFYRDRFFGISTLSTVVNLVLSEELNSINQFYSELVYNYDKYIDNWEDDRSLECLNNIIAILRYDEDINPDDSPIKAFHNEMEKFQELNPKTSLKYSDQSHPSIMSLDAKLQLNNFSLLSNTNENASDNSIPPIIGISSIIPMYEFSESSSQKDLMSYQMSEVMTTSTMKRAVKFRNLCYYFPANQLHPIGRSDPRTLNDFILPKKDVQRIPLPLLDEDVKRFYLNHLQASRQYEYNHEITKLKPGGVARDLSARLSMHRLKLLIVNSMNLWRNTEKLNWMKALNCRNVLRTFLEQSQAARHDQIDKWPISFTEEETEEPSIHDDQKMEVEMEIEENTLSDSEDSQSEKDEPDDESSENRSEDSSGTKSSESTLNSEKEREADRIKLKERLLLLAKLEENKKFICETCVYDSHGRYSNHGPNALHSYIHLPIQIRGHRITFPNDFGLNLAKEVHELCRVFNQKWQYSQNESDNDDHPPVNCAHFSQAKWKEIDKCFNFESKQLTKRERYEFIVIIARQFRLQNSVYLNKVERNSLVEITREPLAPKRKKWKSLLEWPEEVSVASVESPFQLTQSQESESTTVSEAEADSSNESSLE